MNKQQRNSLSAQAAAISSVVDDITNQSSDFEDLNSEDKIADAALKALSLHAGVLDDIRSEIEGIKDDEAEKFANMPEGLQGSDRGQAMESAADALGEAESELEAATEELNGLSATTTYEEAIDVITSTLEHLESALSSIETASE